MFEKMETLNKKEGLMKMKKFNIPTLWRGLLAAVIIMAVCFAPGPAVSAENISPDADKILQSMSSYLGGVKAFSVSADVDFEIVGKNGQKLQLSSLVSLVMERPTKFHVTRKGLIADADFIFDGETLTLYGKNINAFAQIKVFPGSIDNAILTYELMTGLPAPGADLMFADPYAVLSAGVENSAYVGTTFINGIECHHLAFREAGVDWKLWVKTGDEPLPMKYVISSKWVMGAPQYEIRLRDWNTSPKIKDGQFAFTVPEGAEYLEAIEVDDLGELISAEEGQ
jgi:hypothetical protein